MGDPTPEERAGLQKVGRWTQPVDASKPLWFCGYTSGPVYTLEHPDRLAELVRERDEAVALLQRVRGGPNGMSMSPLPLRDTVDAFLAALGEVPK